MNHATSSLRFSLWLGTGLLACALATSARSESPRVLPAGQLPSDHRFEKPKGLDGYFPFTPASSPAEWQIRAEKLRRQLLVANGLWPMPTRTPDCAVIHGRVDRDGYTVEKVYLESFPGHFVTGNLYRPKDRSGKLPGVLCPHGHWPNGRFQDAGVEAARRAITEGAERFESGGRYPLQARCVQLARMGCVVFHYDMVGYADSVQLPHYLGILPPKRGPEFPGFFSARAELRLQSWMGLQTYNSIRALDWFSQLPDVDPARIGVTGASGGGTQTFVLCAIDPRPAVAFPAVMVSTAMQGGCICENSCYLRVGTGNVEIAALIAPRPLGMTAANDWTKDILAKGLPELKQHYRMLGAENNVMAKALVQFPHNYNFVSREVMYQWMNRHLKLGLNEPVLEEDFSPLTKAEMSVWDRDHARPKGGVQNELALVNWMSDDSDRQMKALTPTDAKSLDRFRQIVGGALETMIGRAVPQPGAVKAIRRQAGDKGSYRLERMLLRYEAGKEEVPAILLEPKKAAGQVRLVIDGRGKQGLWNNEGQLCDDVRKSLEAGAAVLAIDVFGTGEFTADGKPLKNSLVIKEHHWDCSLAYTVGYNPPLFAQRVHDILSAVSFARDNWPKAAITLDARHGAGPWGAAARAIAGGIIEKAMIRTDGFAFAKITALDDPNMLPGAVKYLDLAGMLALSAPHELNLDAAPADPLVQAAYRVSGHAERLRKR